MCAIKNKPPKREGHQEKSDVHDALTADQKIKKVGQQQGIEGRIDCIWQIFAGQQAVDWSANFHNM